MVEDNKYVVRSSSLSPEDARNLCTRPNKESREIIEESEKWRTRSFYSEIIIYRS